MNKVVKILLPVDFSKGSEEAADFASELCKRFGAHLRLLHVVETGPYIAYGTWPDELLREFHKNAEEKMNQFKKRFNKNIALTWHIESDAPNAAKAICDEAEDQKMDLIVIAKHSKKGLDRLLVGSTTERVVRISRCPVLSIPVGP